MLLQNKSLINSKVEIEGTIFAFDVEGITDVQPDELAEKLRTLNPKYRAVETPDFTQINLGNDENNGEGEDDKKDVETFVEVGVEVNGIEQTVEIKESTLEDIIENHGISEVTDAMTHDELDAVATSLIEEGRLDESEYKKAKTKKDKVEVINSK